MSESNNSDVLHPVLPYKLIKAAVNSGDTAKQMLITVPLFPPPAALRWVTLRSSEERGYDCDGVPRKLHSLVSSLFPFSKLETFTGNYLAPKL